MTIQSATRKAAFVGNGAATAFPFAFKVFAKSDIRVIRTDAAGAEQVLALNTDYDVALSGNQTSSPGGTVTYPLSGAALATGHRLTIVGNLPIVQPTEITNGGGFYPKVIEDSLDRATIVAQQLQEQIDRAIKVPVSSAIDPDALIADLTQSASDALAAADDAAASQGAAASAASGAATHASSAAAAAASAAAALAGFSARYLGAKAADPTADNAGAALAVGALYLHTGSMRVRVYTGQAWQDWSGDAAQSAFLQAGTGAAQRSLQAKLRDTVSPLDFGAAGDGVTDDTAAFQAAVNTRKEVIVPYRAAGYVVNGLVLPTGAKIRGESRLVMLKSSAAYCIRVAPGEVFEVENFWFDMSAAPAGSTAIRLGTSSGVVWRARLRNLTFQHCVEAIGDEAGSFYSVDVFAQDVYCRFTRGRQIHSRRSRGFFLLRDVVVDHTFNLTQIAWEGIRLEDVIGVELDRVDVVGPTSLTVTPAFNSTTGLVIAGAEGGNSSVWMRRVLVDNSMGDGILVHYIANLQIEEAEAYQNLGAQIRITNCSRVLFNKLFAVGCVGVPGAAAGANGITFDACAEIVGSNLMSRANTGTGVYLHDTAHANVSGIHVWGNSAWGWVEDGTSDRNVKTNARIYNNTSGSLSQAGAQSAMCQWIPNSGVFTAQSLGALTVL